MKSRYLKAVCAWAILAATSPLATAALAQGETTACDRACLTGLADQMVQAILANDGSHLPLTKDFRYTENGQTLKIGDGLWGTLSAYAGQNVALVPAASDLDYHVSAVDPARGEIGYVVEIDENGTQGVLILRLKTQGKQIAEAEAIAVREEFGGDRGGTVTLFQPRLLLAMDGELVQAADPIFTARTASAVSTGAMVQAANRYFDAIESSRSKGVPFAADCLRRDNGVQTTGRSDAKPLDPKTPGFRPFALSCAAQIDSGFYGYVGKVRDRRFLVDAENGLLLSLEMVDIPGTTSTFNVPGVGKVSYPGPRKEPLKKPVEQFEAAAFGANMISPSTAHSATLFKFVNGNIARIDSFARGAPYGMRPGWTK